ncbi:radical SAM protein [Actinomadura atramentaria]|uniref:radical SAM protein n=1 Tax=Actinomadura atramentaria TaxID=1990 RepID=UPI00036EF91C|nr:radical SAM protein [Actinomadura atramentaria]
MTVIAKSSSAGLPITRFLWLDLTRKCQLACTHCYNSSGPDGGHGTMTRRDWLAVLDQAAACGVRAVQFIGGEPTLHPDAPNLVAHALDLGINVEVYSNLVHVSTEWWRLFQRDGISLATSYYSDQAAEHNAITGRPSHARTRANIEKAVSFGIPLRVGIIATDDAQRVTEARRELEALGVTRIGLDHARPFGRASGGREPDPSGLCGNCGHGAVSVGPAGDVSPCVFSGWMAVGNVHDTSLAAILGGTAMERVRASIRSTASQGICQPDICEPDHWCKPGYPDSGCNPRY